VAITQDKRACPVCGTLLPDDGAYCPVCALHGTLQTNTRLMAAGYSTGFGVISCEPAKLRA
jgi:predicted amidophosphoribosyltransferase